MKILQAVNKTFDVTAYVAYVRDLQNTDGGFWLWPKDVSTSEATWIALRVLESTKAAPRDQDACVRYLKQTLVKLTPQADRYWDLEIQRDVFRCLITTTPFSFSKYNIVWPINQFPSHAIAASWSLHDNGENGLCVFALN